MYIWSLLLEEDAELSKVEDTKWVSVPSLSKLTHPSKRKIEQHPVEELFDLLKVKKVSVFGKPKDNESGGLVGLGGSNIFEINLDK